jgi:hypothetical protein
MQHPMLWFGVLQIVLWGLWTFVIILYGDTIMPRISIHVSFSIMALASLYSFLITRSLQKGYMFFVVVEGAATIFFVVLAFNLILV